MVNPVKVFSFAVLVALTCAAAPAAARDTEGTMSITGRFCRDFGPDQSKHLARICLTSLNIGWRIGSFLGSPVLNTAARWQAEEKLHTRDGRVRDLTAVPAPVRAAYERIVPYNARIAAIAWGEGASGGPGLRKLQLPGNIRAALVFDPGAWAASGQQRSYNRPGSPSWATLFKQARSSDACAARANEDLPAEEAKTIVRTGAVLGEPAICEMQFSGLGDLDRALAAEAAEVAAKAPRIDARVGSALDRALGLPQTPAQAGNANPTPSAQAKPGSGADALANAMNRKFGNAPATGTSKVPGPAPATAPKGSGDVLADAFGKVQQKDKTREKQAKALTGTVTQQMARVAAKCHCYLSGRNCPSALADRSWLYDNQARAAFDGAVGAARSQCNSWTALRVRNMTEANKADVLPARKVELIRAVTSEGEKALAAIAGVESQASYARTAAIGREDARRRAEEERRARAAQEAEERRVAEAKRKREEEAAEERRERRRRERQRQMTESNSGPNYDPGMKAMVDAARGWGGGGRDIGGWGALPGTGGSSGRSDNAPSRSYESSSRSSGSSRSSSYENSSRQAPQAPRTRTVTVYHYRPWAFSNATSKTPVGNYSLYKAARSSCFLYPAEQITIYRLVLSVNESSQSHKTAATSESGALAQVEQSLGQGNPREYHVARSRSDAERWLRGQGCKRINS